MIFVADATRHRVRIGREWEDLTGQPVADALGLGWVSRVYPQDLPGVRQVVATAVSSAIEFSVRYRILQADDRPC